MCGLYFLGGNVQDADFSIIYVRLVWYISLLVFRWYSTRQPQCFIVSDRLA